ncbi:DNA adenine methylase [Candidatus Poribacteria bacterium]|nr:DNA adenine methylase [Candidatus Poribacteria bacterium]
MPFYSPLRYPGGKRRLTPLIVRILMQNNLRDIHYVEPFAGGGAIALALLFNDFASTIHVNDLSRPVYSFWHSMVNNADELCHRIVSTEINMTEWYRQKEIYNQRKTADLLDLGFATFYLNRTNRSGIIGGGVLGGKDQQGKWKLDARFNKNDLVERILKIKRHSERISVSNEDAIELLKKHNRNPINNAFYFIDPPYIARGRNLYFNNYETRDHLELQRHVLKLRAPWAVTYDYDGVRKEALFKDQRKLEFELSYSAQKKEKGKEILIVGDDVALVGD